MSKNISRSKILEEKLIRATVNILNKRGGVMPYKELAEEITRTVVFDEWELSAIGRNQRPRWYSRLQACSNDLVKAGNLIKSRGTWGLTNNSSSLLDLEEFNSLRLVKTQYISPKLSDEEWLNILAGKDSGFSDKRIVSQIRTLGLVIKKVDAENKKEAEELIKLESRLNKEGLFYIAAPTIKNKFLKLINKIKLIIIFVIGLIVGIMAPMQLATRGASDSLINKISSEFKASDQIASEVLLEAENPLTLSENIIFTCLSSGVEVKVISNGDIQLIIYGLKKLDDKQNILKIILGLSSAAEGNVKVTIKKK